MASFHADYVSSLDALSAHRLVEILRPKFPHAIVLRKATREDDQSGTDYWLLRSVGHPISIDLKIRSKDYLQYGQDDLCIELSSAVGQQAGWSVDRNKATDYVLFYWADTQRSYLAPFAGVLAVTDRYRDEWSQRYGVKRVANRGYWGEFITEIVFVPTAEFERALVEWQRD